MAERTYPNAAKVFGRLVLTTCRQGSGNPVIDGCHVWSVDGWDCTGWAIRPQRGHGKALVIGWKGWPGHRQITIIRRALRIPLLRRLFLARP